MLICAENSSRRVCLQTHGQASVIEAAHRHTAVQLVDGVRRKWIMGTCVFPIKPVLNELPVFRTSSQDLALLVLRCKVVVKSNKELDFQNRVMFLLVLNWTNCYMWFDVPRLWHKCSHYWEHRERIELEMEAECIHALTPPMCFGGLLFDRHCD